MYPEQHPERRNRSPRRGHRCPRPHATRAKARPGRGSWTRQASRGEYLASRPDLCARWTASATPKVRVRTHLTAASAAKRACGEPAPALSLRNVMKEAPFGGTLWLSPKTGQEGGPVHHVACWVGSQSQARRRLPDLRSG